MSVPHSSVSRGASADAKSLLKDPFEEYLREVFKDLQVRDNGGTQPNIAPYTFIKVINSTFIFYSTLDSLLI